MRGQQEAKRTQAKTKRAFTQQRKDIDGAAAAERLTAAAGPSILGAKRPRMEVGEMMRAGIVPESDPISAVSEQASGEI